MNIKTVTKKNGQIVYRASVYLGVDAFTGKKVQTNITASTKKAVKMKAQQAITEFHLNGNTRLDNVAFKTFQDLTISWWDNHKLSLKHTTIVNKENFIFNYIIPTLGYYKINKITTRLIQTIVNQWAANANNSDRNTMYATKSYGAILAMIKTIFRYGKNIGVVSENPALDVILPKLKRRKTKTINYLDTETLIKWRAYLETLPDKEIVFLKKTLYQLLLATGLRIGEALALSWSDIDFDNNTLHVGHTVDNEGNLIETPKTESSIRDVSFDVSTKLMLKVYRQRQNLIFSQTKISSNNIIFATDIGTYYRPGNMRCKLRIDLQKSGIHEKGISFHIFRHTHASILLNSGVGYKEISQRLGHSDIGITMNRYSHLSKENANKVADVFAEYQKSLSS
ncbi:site-specific integrase [Lactococcus hodotermopsidis]|uniref:Site-specific integrase n=1 Tax=Pseudolactococcus hodotermopsidis TaxID=2709157 RepID=A0A6A0BDA4_9LACT|nr:site-specific integrase [Lactococcus hodotermopsidis]GFH43392.1 site-specific integrase [Lactococcus hodotermopsidis]